MANDNKPECEHPEGCLRFDRYDEDGEPISYCGWCYSLERKEAAEHRVLELIEARLDWRESRAVALDPGIHDMSDGWIARATEIIVRRGAVLRLGDNCTIDTLNLHGGKVSMRAPGTDACIVNHGVQKP